MLKVKIYIQISRQNCLRLWNYINASKLRWCKGRKLIRVPYYPISLLTKPHYPCEDLSEPQQERPRAALSECYISLPSKDSPGYSCTEPCQNSLPQQSFCSLPYSDSRKYFLWKIQVPGKDIQEPNLQIIVNYRIFLWSWLGASCSLKASPIAGPHGANRMKWNKSGIWGQSLLIQNLDSVISFWYEISELFKSSEPQL